MNICTLEYNSTHLIKKTKLDLSLHIISLQIAYPSTFSCTDLFYLLMSTRLLILHLKLKEEPVLFKTEQYVDAKFSFFYGLIHFPYFYFSFVSSCFSADVISAAARKGNVFKVSNHQFSFNSSLHIWGLTMKWLSWYNFLIKAAVCFSRPQQDINSRIYWKSLRNWVG